MLERLREGFARSASLVPPVRFRRGYSAMPSRLRNCLLALSICTLSTTAVFAQSHWTQFRGPNGTGISSEKGIPLTWSPGDFAFNIELNGRGHGSPIIWGEKLFITTSINDTEQEGGAQRFLNCLNASTGEPIWTKPFGFNSSHIHLKNSFSSSTPCTDGERVYVGFADEQRLTLSAYDFEGNLEWRRMLGPFTSQHGFGVSPIVWNGIVFLTKDMMGPSQVFAFDAKTGETKWSILRNIRRTSYATPMILELPGQEPQLICVSGASGITGHNPYTGETLWWTSEFPQRTVASPVFANGLIIASCGGGGRGSDMWAIDPTGRGDVTETHIKWKRTRELPYVPTPIVYGDHLYLWCDLGIVCCVETATGKTLWTERVSDKTVSGSPICIDGKIYCADEDGIVAVIDAAPEFKLHGKSPLGEGTHATPAVAAGRLYFHTFHRLVCLQAESSTAGQ